MQSHSEVLVVKYFNIWIEDVGRGMVLIQLVNEVLQLNTQRYTDTETHRHTYNPHFKMSKEIE
jgi:hypothetical protein